MTTDRVALAIEDPTWMILALIVVAMMVGTIVRLIMVRSKPDGDVSSRLSSLKTWWLLVLLFCAAVLGGPLGVCLFMAIASWIGVREFTRLIVEGNHQRRTARLFHLLVPVTFAAITLGFGPWALSIVPMASVLLIAISQVADGAPSSYVRNTGGLLLGSVTLIYGLGHAALLATEIEPGPNGPRAAGWFVFLVLLTEVNDISQALVGRRIGRTKITPRLSPNKSLEGLIGGMLVTVMLSLLLAPWLTTLASTSAPGVGRFVWPIAAGVVISLAGFLGDLNMSGVKRFVGVKDSSDALPGMGGVLDRVDSLTLTAPCFYWIIVLPSL